MIQIIENTVWVFTIWLKRQNFWIELKGKEVSDSFCINIKMANWLLLLRWLRECWVSHAMFFQFFSAEKYALLAETFFKTPSTYSPTLKDIEAEDLTPPSKKRRISFSESSATKQQHYKQNINSQTFIRCVLCFILVTFCQYITTSCLCSCSWFCNIPNFRVIKASTLS